ncbi:hypothetical protein AYI70_g5658 [Smittium culicis]|uniref:Uncharacterized protein n=1 Tax=Smittium culicis TaxID=133412 RepID=A0A1R1XTG2_9FUNG|nr:hypothetical protein AYI70_g5658 [Smittium culicis]
MLFNNLTKFAVGLSAFCAGAFAQGAAQCTNTFSDINVECASNTIKVYEIDSVIKVPCSSKQFEISFDVEGTTDVHFAISGSEDPEAPSTVTGNVAFYLEDWFLGETVNAPAVAAAALTESGATTATVKFTADGIELYRGDTKVSFTNYEDFQDDSFQKSDSYYIYFAAGANNTPIKNISVVCSGDSICEAKNCSSAQNILNLSNTSGNRNREYNVENPIMLPCTTPGFNVTLQVNADSDLYLAFSNEKGVYGADGVIEVQFGLASGRTSVSRGRYSQAKRDMLSKRYVTGLVNVEYDGSVMTIKNNRKTVMTYKVNNYKITQFYFASQTGTAVIVSGTAACYSADFCEDKQLECTSVTKLPNNSNTAAASKVYNEVGQYFLRCGGKNFEFESEIETTSDIYFFLGEPVGTGSPYAEIRVGVFTTNNNISPNAYNFVSAANIPLQTGAKTTVTLKVTYIDSVLTFFVDGTQKGTRNMGTFSPTRINLSPLSGTLSYKSATITCLNQVAGC